MSLHNLLSVSVFGLVGILLRYGIDRVFFRWNSQFPTSTLIINILGSLFAGLIYALSLSNKTISETLQTGLLVGFCGGFTTFSAYTLQTLQMVDKGKITQALFYLTISPVLGLAVAFLPVIILKKN